MIRIRLYILQFASLLLIVSLGTWMLMRVDASSRERAQTYAGALLEQAVVGIQSTAAEAAEMTRTFAYSEAVQRIITGDSLGQRVLDYRSANWTHQFVTSTNRIALDFALQLNDGRFYMFGPMLSFVARREIFRQMSEEDRDNRQGVFIFFDYEDAAPRTVTRRLAYVLPIYASTMGESVGRRVGHCILLCDTAPFFDLLSAADNDEVRFRLSDGGALVWGWENGRPNGEAETLRANVQSTGWDLDIDYFGDPARQQSGEYRLFAYAAMITVAVVLLSLSAVIHHDITRPARVMQRQLNAIATDPGDQRLTVMVNNELGAITGYVNHMLDRIQCANQLNIENQRRLLETDLALNRLQLKALQSQINPHFLYNTLAGMRAQAQAQGAPAIAKMAASMAALFRYSIKGDPYVPVEDEVDITRKYLEIMNQRMDDKFEVEVKIPDILLDSYLVKMVLQPVVENAIYHGLEGKRGKGKLTIEGHFLNEDSYCLRVIDNGLGMYPADVQALNRRLDDVEEEEDEQRENRSIGLTNINRKIKLLTGERYGVRVESELKRGTTVILTLPYLPNLPRQAP